MEEELKKVRAALISSSSVVWVGVFGMGGAGKSLLAKIIQEEPPEQFEFVFRITLGLGNGLQVNVAEHLQKLQNQILPTKQQSYGPEMITLKNLFTTSKFLLVIDDVWEDALLRKLKVMVEGNTSCRILVTSRNDTILNSVAANDQVERVRFGGLSEKESKELFCRHAFCSTSEPPPNVSQYVSAIVRACGGLPLALKVLGRAMAPLRDDIEMWKERVRMVEGAKLLDEHEDNKRYLKRLKLGYDALIYDPKFKYQECFLYLANWPQGRLFLQTELQLYWEAEGLIPNRDGAAAKVFNTLERQGLVERIPHDRKAFIHPRDCELLRQAKYRLHDILHDMAIHVMDTERRGFYHKWSTDHEAAATHEDLTTFVQKNRLTRISLHEELPLQTARLITFRHATTLFLCDLCPSNAFLFLFPQLQVLEIIHTQLYELPQSIGLLTGLIYLDFSHNTCLKKVPYEAIATLVNLRYLDYRWCPMLDEFPVDALPRLRNLTFLQGWESRGAWQCRKRHGVFNNKKTCMNQMLLENNVTPSLRLDIGMLHKLCYVSVDTKMSIVVPSSIRQLSRLKNLQLESSEGYVQVDDAAALKGVEFLRLINLKEDGEWHKAMGPSIQVLVIKIWRRGASRAGEDGNYSLCLSRGNGFRLEKLELDGCNKLVELAMLQDESHQSQLQDLCIRLCDSLRSIPLLKSAGSSSLKQLSEISIIACHALEAVDIGGDVNKQQLMLEKVRLSVLDELKSVSMPEMKYLPRLEVLNIFECPSLESLSPLEISGHPRLESLSIRGVHGILEKRPMISLDRPHAFPALRHLECWRLDGNCRDAAPLLSSLGISNSNHPHKDFAVFHQAGANVSSLEMWYSETEVVDEEWLSSFTDLRFLELHQLPNLVRIPECVATKLHKLETLFIDDCPGLEQGLPCIDDPGSYPSLKKLEVRNAPSIHRPQRFLNILEV